MMEGLHAVRARPKLGAHLAPHGGGGGVPVRAHVLERGQRVDGGLVASAPPMARLGHRYRCACFCRRRRRRCRCRCICGICDICGICCFGICCCCCSCRCLRFSQSSRAIAGSVPPMSASDVALLSRSLCADPCHGREAGDCVAMAERRQPILESDISGDRDLWFGKFVGLD